MEEFKDLAEFALTHSQDIANNIEYVDVRLEFNAIDTISFINGKLHVGNLPIDLTTDAFARKFGLNIRMLVKGGMGMSTINELNKSAIKGCIEDAYRNALRSSKLRKSPIRLSEEKVQRASWSSEYKINPMDISLEEKIEFIQGFVNIFKEKRAIEYFHIFVLISEQREVYFLNNEGSQIQAKIPRVAFIPIIIGIKAGGKNEQSMTTHATSGGWDGLLSWNLKEKVIYKVEILEKILTKAKKPPTGEIDVILGPEVGGIIAHENCGHPHEADRIIGREGAQAGESYLREHEIGFKIGNDCVNVYDDPTIPKSYGFYLYDDEGVKARKRELIKDGYFNEMLHNRETAPLFNTKSNASARAVFFDREPIIRMANTFFAPGDYSLEEMVEDVKLGILMNSFTEWNIDDKRLQSKYVGQEAFLIEKGEITKTLVQKPVLEISSIGLFSSIDAQGKIETLDWQGAFCGKSEPGQGCPVWTGSPYVRLRKVRLG